MKHINVDKTELVLIYLQKKKYASTNLTYDQIIRIQFDKCWEFSLFGKIPSEKIQIVTRKQEKPIEFTKRKEKKFFDEYKKELVAFVKRNRVSFVNNLDETM